jgi:CO/xanthine dehydrogenase FAD-binding subunit
MRQGIYDPDVLVDIANLQELRGVLINDERIIIGAATTISEIVEREDIRALHPMLCNGLAKIATQQIRNVATIAGDLSQEKRCWFFRSGAQCYKAGGPSCPCYAVLGDTDIIPYLAPADAPHHVSQMQHRSLRHWMQKS